MALPAGICSDPKLLRFANAKSCNADVRLPNLCTFSFHGIQEPVTLKCVIDLAMLEDVALSIPSVLTVLAKTELSFP